MNKQTAVKFLIEKIDFDANVRCFSKDEWKEIFEQAKQMEKEQIVNAVDGFPLYTRDLLGDDYYNELYGGENE
jgi:hypothetical protein